MEWISVKDKLPELFELVIINEKQGVTAATRHDEYWWDRQIGNICKNVTHWMPLPNPPK